jgi:ferredoxin
MKKPVIDLDACEGCGSCVEMCPEVFEMQDDGKAHVIAPEKCDSCDCQAAADICPVEAITFVEE